MNGKWYIVVVIWFTWVFPFTFHDDLIPMTFDNEALEKPFLGGFNHPKIQWLDLDTDGDLDLFILDVSGYLRFLENQGTANVPNFHLITTSYQDIYCGGWFHFADFDFDGDFDLTAQNGDDDDHISYFQNFGGELAFMEVLIAVGGGYVTSKSNMTPTFADIDNDGDLDFFTGNDSGTLTYYENTDITNDIPQLEFITHEWQNIYIIGGNCTTDQSVDDRHGASAITFIDLDSDGDLDLSWGDYFQQSLYIIWNSGSAETPDMIEVTTEYPPEDPIMSSGQNMPTFSDLDADGDMDLFVTVLFGACGDQLGEIVDNFFYYENIGSSLDPLYNYVTKNYFSTLDLISDSSPELIDIDQDGDLDLFIGNHADLYPIPWEGKIHFFRNMGDESNPLFEEETVSFLDADMGTIINPELGDLDGDGDMDLLVGNKNGIIQYFENTSSGSSLTFTFIENVGSIDLSGNSVPTLGDLDADGDLDLLVGHKADCALCDVSTLVFYRNIGSTSEYNFQEETFDDIQAGGYSAPELMDMEGDGDLDLVLGSENEGLEFYRNLGSSSNFQFQLDSNMSIPNIGMYTKPSMGNIYCGKLDIITGISTGGLYHIQRDTDIALGDLNGDGGWNVLDVVVLVNCVLSNNCADIENGCTGDINGDGGFNVLDVVTLVNCVLSNNCGG